MINFRDEEGRLLLPRYLVDKPSLYRRIQKETAILGISGFIPFSSLHRYQRKDSVWAQEHVVRLDDYAASATDRKKKKDAKVFPAFIRYCCETDTFKELHPSPTEDLVYEPADFGDDWSDELEKEDIPDATRYFQAIEHLRDAYGFVNLRVGGRDNVIDLSRGRKTGVTFE